MDDGDNVFCADCWKDAKAQEFERLYIQELSARMDKAATALEKLDRILTKVRDDCE